MNGSSYYAAHLISRISGFAGTKPGCRNLDLAVDSFRSVHVHNMAKLTGINSRTMLVPSPDRVGGSTFGPPLSFHSMQSALSACPLATKLTGLGTQLSMSKPLAGMPGHSR